MLLISWALFMNVTVQNKLNTRVFSYIWYIQFPLAFNLIPLFLFHDPIKDTFCYINYLELHLGFINYLEFFYIGHLSFPSHLFIYLIIYVYHFSRDMDIYLLLWVVAEYCSILLFKCSIFGNWEMFLLGSVSFSHPINMGFI